MEQQLKDLRAAAMGATPEALLQKIEEETKVNTYIVMQKLPKEIDAKRKMVENLQKVIDQPALGQDDILDLKEKIKIARNEIEELTSKKNVSNDPMEDKLTLFRQRVRLQQCGLYFYLYLRFVETPYIIDIYFFKMVHTLKRKY